MQTQYRYIQPQLTWFSKNRKDKIKLEIFILKLIHILENALIHISEEFIGDNKQ